MQENCNINGQLITCATIPAGFNNSPESQVVPIVFDERDGKIVYIKPARPGEKSEGVWISGCERPVLRIELSHVFFDVSPEPIRVVPEGREGTNVFYRRLNPGEADVGKTVKFIPGEEQLVMVERVVALGIHLSPEVGRKDDLLTAMRVVPDGREGSTVYARTLQPGEPDTGEAVILRPGDNLTFRPGSVCISVEGIDALIATPHQDGYAPISNTLWTWLSFAGNHTPDSFRFIITAARRLDASHRLFEEVRDKLIILGKPELGAFEIRNLLYEVVGSVELAIVSMYRAIDMVSQLEKHFPVSTSFPSRVNAKLAQIKQLRDSYEHIDERARELKYRKYDPDALSVFEFNRLFEKGIISYGSNSLDIHTETTEIFLDLREYLKVAAGELSNGCSTTVT